MTRAEKHINNALRSGLRDVSSYHQGTIKVSQDFWPGTAHRALVYPFPGLNPALSVPQSLKSPCSASQRLDPLVTLSSLLDIPSVTCSVGPRPTLIPLWLCLRASTNERAQHRDSVQNTSLTITMSTSYSKLRPHHRSLMIDRRPLHPAASPGVPPVQPIWYSGHVVHSFRSA